MTAPSAYTEVSKPTVMYSIPPFAVAGDHAVAKSPYVSVSGSKSA